MAESKSLGAGSTFGAYMQLGQTLISGYNQRWNTRLQGRQISFQNGINSRQMSVQNSNRQSEWVVARAQAALGRAQAAAENRMREAGNIRSQSDASLDNWARSVANSRMLASGGEAREALVTNQLRAREQSVGEGIEARLVAAEQRGAFAAATAMAGVSGGSVDQVASAMELRTERRDFYQQRANGYADYDAMQQIIGIIPQMTDSLDLRVSQASKDFGMSVGPMDPLKPVDGVSFNQQVPRVWGNLGTDAMSWFFDSNNKAAAQAITDRVSSWFTPSAPSVPMFNALP